jgi:hypothetical protein
VTAHETIDDRVADADRCQRRQAEATACVEAVNCFDQANSAIRHDIRQFDAAVIVLPRDLNDKPQIRLNEALSGAAIAGLGSGR